MTTMYVIICFLISDCPSHPCLRTDFVIGCLRKPFRCKLPRVVIWCQVGHAPGGWYASDWLLFIVCLPWHPNLSMWSSVHYARLQDVHHFWEWYLMMPTCFTMKRLPTSLGMTLDWNNKAWKVWEIILIKGDSLWLVQYYSNLHFIGYHRYHSLLDWMYVY